MTKKEVRNFFKALKGKRARRRSLISERERATEELCQIRAVDYEKPRVSGGNGVDISKILEAAEAENQARTVELARLILEIEKETTKAYNMISSCDTDQQKSVLVDHWMREMPWKMVAEVHHYSRDTILKTAAAAVAAIARNYKGADANESKA